MKMRIGVGFRDEIRMRIEPIIEVSDDVER